MSASHRHFADEDIVPTVPTCPPHICTRRAFWPKIVLIGEHFSFESGDKDGDGQAKEDDDDGKANEGDKSGHESGHDFESFAKKKAKKAAKGDESGHESGYESGDKGGGDGGDSLEDMANEVDGRRIQQRNDWAMVRLAKRHRK